MFVSLAQQEAQRAQFYVEKAKQDQRQNIIQAGEAEAAKMVRFYYWKWTGCRQTCQLATEGTV